MYAGAKRTGAAPSLRNVVQLWFGIVSHINEFQGSAAACLAFVLPYYVSASVMGKCKKGEKVKEGAIRTENRPTPSPS